MKIIQDSPEVLLYEMAKSIEANAKSWRAIHLEFSSIRAKYGEGLRSAVLVNIIRDLLRNEDGSVFLCDDQDIIILFQGAVTRILEGLGEHITIFISNAQPGEPVENADQFCHTYDLGKHMEPFMALCEMKYKQIAGKNGEHAYPPALKEDAHYFSPNMELFNKVVEQRAQREGLSILLVEDDSFTRRLVGNLLRPSHHVMEAETALSALELYNLHAPDLVFLDIELPDLSGHIVLQHIQQLDTQSFVVMLSGNSFKENILAALEDGAQGFITKPFSKDKLLRYLQSCEHLRARQREQMSVAAPQ